MHPMFKELFINADADDLAAQDDRRRRRHRSRRARPALIIRAAARPLRSHLLGPDRLPWPGGLAWPTVAGIALIIAGIGLRAWSIATLGAKEHGAALATLNARARGTTTQPASRWS